MRILWGPLLRKHIQHPHMKTHQKQIIIRASLSYAHCEPRCSEVSRQTPFACNEMVRHPKWIIDNSMVKSWHGGQSQRVPKQQRGHTGHGLGPGHSWLMQLGLSGKWLSKQGPEWLPLTGTSALSPLIHSKEPQSNTQRHTVTSNNTAQSGGTWNESHWPKHRDRRQFAHQIWAQKTVQLNCRTDDGCGWWSQSNFFEAMELCNTACYLCASSWLTAMWLHLYIEREWQFLPQSVRTH